MGPQPPPKKGVELPKFSAHVYCSQTAGCIKMALVMEVGLTSGDFVLDGDPAPLTKRGRAPPQFSAMSIVAKRLHGSSLTNFVLDGAPAPFPKKGVEPPKFLAHVYCDQTAGCIKMALGMEVGLIQGDFMLDGDPALLPKKGAESLPNFRPCLLWQNGCMDQDAT